MTEEQKAHPENPAEEKETGSHQIFEEFQNLGQELASAFQAMWESPESRKLRNELHEGFSEIGRQIDSAVTTAKDSDAAKQFSEQVRDTVEKARESETTAKLEEGLVMGLRELNSQISKFVGSVEASEAGEPAKETAEEEAEPEA